MEEDYDFGEYDISDLSNAQCWLLRESLCSKCKKIGIPLGAEEFEWNDGLFHKDKLRCPQCKDEYYKFSRFIRKLNIDKNKDKD